MRARIYGQSGVPEYWVLDINARRLLVHDQPGASGCGRVTKYSDTDTVTPASAPGQSFLVADILP